jgi:hypothetical protein
VTDAGAGPQFSEDRQWWWTGSEWVPASQAPVQPDPLRTSAQTTASIAPRRSGSFPRWLVIVAAILFFPITVVILIVRTKWSGRTKAILSGVWVVFVIVVGVTGAGSSSQTPGRQSSVLTSPGANASPSQTAASPSASAAATPTPRATPSPTPPAPPPTPTPPVPAQTVVTFLNAPLTVARGSNATLQVMTAANTSCAIEVDYKSGPSTAAGLVVKTSDGAGNVSWTWKVGANTTPGAWPIKVTCGNGTAQTHITVT